MKFPTLPPEPGGGRARGVTFDADGVAYPEGFDVDHVADWLSNVARERGYRIRELSYVLVSDAALHVMNVERLAHDTLTDVITFDLSETLPATADVDAEDGSRGPALEGECYISLDRVVDNADAYREPPLRELHRVMVHGLLHLTGLGDGTREQRALMRQAEDAALASL